MTLNDRSAEALAAKLTNALAQVDPVKEAYKKPEELSPEQVELIKARDAAAVPNE